MLTNLSVVDEELAGPLHEAVHQLGQLGAWSGAREQHVLAGIVQVRSLQSRHLRKDDALR
jgi:hypothetical protein